MLNQPTSSPMITRIFGLRCCCCAAAGKIVTVTAINSDRKPSQILLPAVMSECLPFFEKLEGIPIYQRLCVGWILIGRHRKEYWTLGKRLPPQPDIDYSVTSSACASRLCGTLIQGVGA